jgi:hypothetical protein
MPEAMALWEEKNPRIWKTWGNDETEETKEIQSLSDS